MTARELDDLLEETEQRAESAESRATALEAELSAARTAAGIDAGMPLDEWIKSRIAHHASIVMALYEIDHDIFGPLTCKEGIAELQRERDEAREQRDAAWAEQREVRRLIEADQEESTIDEVTRKMYRLSKDLHDAEKERDELKYIVRGLSKRLSEVAP